MTPIRKWVRAKGRIAVFTDERHTSPRRNPILSASRGRDVRVSCAHHDQQTLHAPRWRRCCDRGRRVALRQQSTARAVTVTAADYARAEKFLAPALNGLVVGGSVAPTWLADDRFWYRTTLADGSTQTILVDPVKKTRTVCTRAIADCPCRRARCRGGRPRSRRRRRWRGAGAGAAVAPATLPTASRSTMSPDGKRGAFVRDWNLWVRDIATGQEQALTTDGMKYFGYAIDNAGWSTSDRAMVSWSPDSRRSPRSSRTSATSARCISCPPTVGHPTLRVSKFPLPGDSVMAMLHRVVIDVDAGTITRLQMPPDFHRGTLGDDIRMGDYVWSPDGARLAIASVSRDHKRAWLQRRRRRDGRRSQGATRKPSRRSTSRARSGRCSGRRTSSSGIPSATTGASSISTTCRPAH